MSFLSRLNQDIVIQRATDTVNTAGTATQTWSEHLSVRGLITMGNGRETYTIGKRTVVATHKLFVEDANITVKDRVGAINYLQNPSFEDSDVAKDWTNSALSSMGQSTAQAKYGSASLKMVYDSVGSGGQSAYQEVLRTLATGDVYTFSVYCRSESAVSHANSFVWLSERDDSELKDFTTTALSLSGGEGWVRFPVSHTITSALSDRLRCYVQINDNVTLYADGCLLEESAVASDFDETYNVLYVGNPNSMDRHLEIALELVS